MQLKTVKTICFTLVAVCCIFLLLLLLMPVSAFGYAAIGAVALMGVFLLLFWRCPHCGKGLGQMEISSKAKYCRYCGKEIDLESRI